MSPKIHMKTEIKETAAHNEPRTPRRRKFRSCLKRVAGLGFGRGQMLVRLNLKDRQQPFAVQEAFLPEGPGNGCRISTGIKWVDVDPARRKSWENYCLVELAYASKTPTAFITYQLDGSAMGGWRPFDWSKFDMNEETKLRVAALTGLDVPQPKFEPSRVARSRQQAPRARYAGQHRNDKRGKTSHRHGR